MVKSPLEEKYSVTKMPVVGSECVEGDRGRVSEALELDAAEDDCAVAASCVARTALTPLPVVLAPTASIMALLLLSSLSRLNHLDAMSRINS